MELSLVTRTSNNPVIYIHLMNITTRHINFLSYPENGSVYQCDVMARSTAIVPFVVILVIILAVSTTSRLYHGGQPTYPLFHGSVETILLIQKASDCFRTLARCEEQPAETQCL